MNKVLLVGIDGGTWNAIQLLIKTGKLPTFKRLIEEGASGPLMSTVPPISAPAWASIYTGKNPGKHGVFEFINQSGEIVTSSHIRERKLWQYLSDVGYSCCIINAPITYPPDNINGYMVSSWLTPAGREDFTYPSSLVKLLKERGYKIDITLGRERLWTEVKNFKNRYTLLKEAYRIMKRRLDVALELMATRNWDFFFIVFTLSDVIQHLFWDKKEVLHNLYSRLDTYIAKLATSFNSNCCKEEDEPYLFVISDHGFRNSPKKALNLFPIIKDFKEVKFTLWDRFWSHPSVFNLLRVKIPRLGKLFDLTKQLPLEINSSGIYIDRRRIRPPQKYEELRQKLIEILGQIESPNKDRKIFTKIWKREDIYSGHNMGGSLDIAFLCQPEYAVYFNPFSGNLWSVYPWRSLPGDHSLEGIVLIFGPGVKKASHIRNASVYDITPTINYIMGLKVPTDTDGNVLVSVLKNDILEKKPIIYGTYGSYEKQHIIFRVRALKERLKKLRARTEK